MKAPSNFKLLARPVKSSRDYDPLHSQHYGRAWQRIRLAFLRANPLCVHCLEAGMTTAATEVDHILRLKRGGTNDFTNLQALCKPCHTRKTRHEQ